VIQLSEWGKVSLPEWLLPGKISSDRPSKMQRQLLPEVLRVSISRRKAQVVLDADVVALAAAAIN
jgi:hypothetical protein